MNPPEFLYHIGHFKTGTTAIQQTLFDDRERLSENGYLYPDAGRPQVGRGKLRWGHHGLVVSIGQPDHRWCWETTDEINKQFQEQIAATEPKTVVMSAENAWFTAVRDPLNRKELKAMKAFAAPSSVRVVACLRRPDTYMMSWQAQMARMGRKVVGIHRPARARQLFERCVGDHRKALEPFLATFGDVGVWRYQEGSDATATFYKDLLGMTAPDGQLRTNVSIPQAFNILSLRYSHKGGTLTKEQISRMREIPDLPRVDLLGRESRELLYDLFAPINDWLGIQFGNEAVFDDLDKIRKVPSNTITVAESASRFSDDFQKIIAST